MVEVLRQRRASSAYNLDGKRISKAEADEAVGGGPPQLEHSASVETAATPMAPHTPEALPLYGATPTASTEPQTAERAPESAADGEAAHTPSNLTDDAMAALVAQTQTLLAALAGSRC